MKLLIIVFILFSLGSFAGSGDKSLSGCGLGWKILPKNSMVSSTTRGTTNGSLSPFSMTFGTMGCAQHSIVYKEKQSEHFISYNFDEVIFEMAQGKGENLEALARTFGCSDASIMKFSQKIRENFSELSTSSNAPEIVKGIQGIVKKDPVLSSQCNAA